jgi:hypothetical protein
MTRPTTGIRRIDRLEGGGVLVCLYGETDLDDVMLAVVQFLAEQDGGQEAWVERTFVPPAFEHPRVPQRALSDDPAWTAYRAAADLWRAEATWTLDEEHPTDHVLQGLDDAQVGYFRKVPCPPQMCGEHSWHLSSRSDERGHSAFLGVYLEGPYA